MLKVSTKVVSVMSAITMACLVASYSRTVSAEPVKAEQAVINDIVARCKMEAKEDKVEQVELFEYLSLCINDELEINDYQMMSKKEMTTLLKLSKK